MDIHLIIGLVAFGVFALGIAKQTLLTLRVKTTKGVSTLEVCMRTGASVMVFADLAYTGHVMMWGSLINALALIVYLSVYLWYRKQ